MPLTDFDVTYGNAIAPAGFHRVTTIDGGSANLNGTGASAQSFLWTHEGSSRGEPVVQLCVTYDDEVPAEGYERVSRNLAKGGATGRRAFLWLRRRLPTARKGQRGNGLEAASVAWETTEMREWGEAGVAQGKGTLFPLVDVVVAFGGADPNFGEVLDKTRQEENPAWERLDRCLNPGVDEGEDPVHLWFRRAQVEASTWSAHDLEVGDWLDVCGSGNTWRMAQVVEINQGALRVCFKGCDTKYNETIHMDSGKVAKLGTHTPPQQGMARTAKEEAMEVMQITKRVEDIALAMINDVDFVTGVDKGTPMEEDARFLIESAPLFVEQCMKKSYLDGQLLIVVNKFLTLMIEVVVMHMMREGQMPRHFLKTLSQLGNNDLSCAWYYSTYGLESQFEVPKPELILTEEQDSVGLVMCSPSVRSGHFRAILGGKKQDTGELFLLNMNHFRRAGGFAAILDRMDPGRQPEPVPLEELVVYLGILGTTFRLLTPTSVERYFEAVQERVFARLDRLSNAELKDLRDAEDTSIPGQIVKDMELILPSVLPFFNVEERLERLHLSLALQLLRCPYLNSKIQGMAFLNDIINRAIVNYRSQTTHDQSQDRNTVVGQLGRNQHVKLGGGEAQGLADCLEEQGVLEVVLGDIDFSGSGAKIKVDPPHVEILRRSTNLLCFMAREGKLSSRHLNLLWAASQGQPDAQVHVVYDLVIELSSRVDVAGLDILHNHLRQLPPTYEEVQIELIKGFAESAAIDGCGSTQHLSEGTVSVFGNGLELLWAAMQDDAPVTAHVADQASQALADLLCQVPGGTDTYGNRQGAYSPAARPSAVNHHLSKGSVGIAASADKSILHQQQLFFLLEMCLENMEKGLSVAPSLRLMQRIIDAQPEVALSRYVSSDGLRKHQLLQRLEDEKDLLTLVVKELLRYRSVATTALKKSGAETDIMSSTFERARMPYGETLKIRLDFLEFAVSKSKIQLTYDHMENLWKSIVLEPLSDQETEMFYEWMWRMAPNGMNSARFKTIGADVAHQIFSNLLCEDGGMRFKRLGREGFSCMWRYFCFVNTQTKAMSLSSNKVLSNFVVDDFSRMDGSSTLWGLFLASDHPVVIREAGQHLVQLHLRLGNPDEWEEVWASLIDRCMSTVEAALNSEADSRAHSSSSQIARIERVVRLMINFISDVTKLTSSSWGRAVDEGYMKVMVHWAGRNKLHRFNWPLPMNSLTVGDLRARVACEMRHPSNQVCLINKLSEVCSSPIHDGFTLEEARVSKSCEAILLRAPDKDTVQFVPQASARARAWEHKTILDFPHERLVHYSNYFSTLFRLLEVDVGQVPLVEWTWMLVKMLPINRHIRNDLEAIRGGGDTVSKRSVDWDKVLGSFDVPLLLYRLQVVLTLVEAADNLYALPGDLADAMEWRKVFLDTGGMHFLLSVLLTEGLLDLSQGLHKACLAILLNLVVHFTLPTALDRRQEMGNGDMVKSEGDDRGTRDGRATVAPNRDRDDAGSEPNAEQLVAKVYSGVDLPKLVHRLLYVMDKVSKPLREPVRKGPTPLEGSFSVEEGRGHVLRRRQSSTGRWEGDSSVGGTEEMDEQNVLPPETEVVQRTMATLVTLTLHEPTLLDVILTFPDLGSTLEFSLLRTPEEMVQKEVAQGVLQMALRLRQSAQEDPVQVFLRLLLDLLPVVDDFQDRCSCYFWLVACLVQENNALEVPHHAQLCLDLAELIVARPVVEQSDTDKDMVLLGYMKVLCSALGALPPTLEGKVKAKAGGNTTSGGRGLVNDLFKQCLFTLPHVPANPAEGTWGEGNDNEDGNVLLPPKCKNRGSRTVAFKLLAELAKGCSTNLHLVTQLAMPHHSISSDSSRKLAVAKEVKEVPLSGSSVTGMSSRATFGSVARLASSGRGNQQQKYGPDTVAQPQAIEPQHQPTTKHKSGFVGLKNLGCICYMNSTLQQLFMMPEFRQGILSFQDSGDFAEDNLMYHLQNTFSHLQESQKAYFNPKGLVRALQDWEGDPVDVMVQQDASEFLTLFFQQVEGCVMGSPWENLLKETFGGVYSNELLAEGGRYSERPEPFSYISVEVKNMKTLHEALAIFTKEETVSYKWDSLQDQETGEKEKITLSTQKQCSIKVLPKHLIIHLKRFGFDFDNMQQTKINDRLEFPTELDMFPYTKDGIAAARFAKAEGSDQPESGHPLQGNNSVKPKAYYQYNLAGVVVHMGTANSGHYYSYISPRDGEGEWIEFNDTVVEEFDPKDLEAECFGGEERVTFGMDTRYNKQPPSTSERMRERNRNAFLLVYDHVPISQDESREESERVTDAVESASSRAACVINNRELAPRSMGKQRRFRAHVPDAIMSAIQQENLDFWRTQNVLDKHNYEFMYKLLVQSVDRNEGKADEEMLQLAARLALGTLVQAEEDELLAQWTHTLIGLFPKQPRSCEWLLGEVSREVSTFEDLVLGSGSLWSRVRELLQVAITAASITTPGGTPQGDLRAVRKSSNRLAVGGGQPASKTAGAVEERAPTAGRVPAVGEMPPVPQFIATCLDLLSASQVEWERVSQLCSLLATFANAGSEQRGLLLSQGALKCAMSLFLAEEWHFSRHLGAPPQRGEGAVGKTSGLLLPSSKAVPVADLEDQDSFALVSVMAPLLRASLLNFGDSEEDGNDGGDQQGSMEEAVVSSQGIRESSPFMLDPQATMSSAEEQILTSPAFIYQLVRALGPPWPERELDAIIGHMCWRNKLMSQLVLNVTCRGVDTQHDSEAHLSKPSFRALILMFTKVTDGLLRWRVETAMPKLLAAMEDQKDLVGATEQAIEMLVRMTKASAEVRRWLADNNQELEWMEIWLHRAVNANKKGGRLTQGQRRDATFKGGGTVGGHMQEGHPRNTGPPTSATLCPRVSSASSWHQVAYFNVQALAQGLDIPDRGYDSDDDPRELVGKRIRVRWAGHKWYFGEVTKYDTVTFEHTVVYDDSDVRQYVMREKNWVLDDSKS